MAKIHKPRAGTLQFWPRRRAERILPSVNWEPLEKSNSKNKVLGFIGYKVGMATAIAKDNTPDSLTKNKKILIPVTIIECPPMKVLAVRFYKNSKSLIDVYSSDLNKHLAGRFRLPKQIKTNVDEIGKNPNYYDNIRILVYTLPEQTNIKKTPDILEIGIKGTPEEKLSIAKSFLGKEIRISNVFEKNELTDIRGITKGKGFAGTIKKYGIALKNHKTEKGIRRPGTLGAWVPKRVTYRAPQAGNLGFASRLMYNNEIIDISKISEKDINPKSGFKHYGVIKTDYIIVKGSVQGPQKRPILMTSTLRPTKKKAKQNFELAGLEK